MWLELPGHQECLHTLLHVNSLVVPMLGHLTQYKAEMGLAFQQAVEVYNMLALEQFSSYYKIEQLREQNLRDKQALIDKQVEELKTMKAELFHQ